ncbi:uncharacterized protein LOC126833904 [Adelges cooleyi]|uniref:uncharacterized protein LOC126833904 n=1 Tax=Adelges cooleyi TaxID=133065 RepID=UPI00217F82EE|nr:uncharacterized protein LOC126833904 [Adelges cooleyi]
MNMNIFILLCLTFFTPSVNSDEITQEEKEAIHRVFHEILDYIKANHPHPDTVPRDTITLVQFLENVGYPTDTTEFAHTATYNCFDGRQHKEGKTVPYSEIVVNEHVFRYLINRICELSKKPIGEFTGLISDIIARKNAEKASEELKNLAVV